MIEKLAADGRLTVDLNGCTDVPEIISEALKKSDAIVTFRDTPLISWRIDGADVIECTEMDLDILYPAQFRSPLPKKPELKFRVSSTNAPTAFVYIFDKADAGKAATIYGEKDGTAFAVCTVTVADDGTAALPLNVAGTYALILNDGLRGDADGNGTINALDAAAILMDIVGIAPAKNKSVCDYTDDGSVNALDAAAILKDIVNGLI